MAEQASPPQSRNALKLVLRVLSAALIAVLLVILVAVWRDPLRWRLAADDFFTLANHQPTQQDELWAEQLGLTERGMELLIVSDAELVDRQGFGNFCPAKEETNVLGCYLSTSKIYVLDVEEADIEGVEAVTLAHEILHAAWDRLPAARQDEVSAELLDYYRDSDDEELTRLIGSYRRSAPTGQADLVTVNELHSILPTEYDDLPVVLEDYYKNYFTDRDRIVEIYESYEAEFESRERQAEELNQELVQLGNDIETLEIQIDQEVARNNSLIAEIDRLRDNGQIEESNQLVPVQNQLVDQINADISDYNAMVERYNSLRESYQQVALELDQLFDSLDTRKPVQ